MQENKLFINEEEEKFNKLSKKEKYKCLKDFINEKKLESEREYYFKLSEKGKQNFENKIIEITKFKKELEKKNLLNINLTDITKIKEFATSEDGFLRNELRIYFYKILFHIEKIKDIDKEKKNSINFLNKKASDDSKYFLKIINLNKKDEKNNHQPYDNDKSIISLTENYNHVKYSSIIEVDVKRTIFNQIFKNSEKEKIILEYLKMSLTQKLKIFFSLEHNFQYYQGFHEIGMFIFILFLNDDETEEQNDIYFYEILQRLCEFYYKDYLLENIKDITNKNMPTHKKCFQFEILYKIINDI